LRASAEVPNKARAKATIKNFIGLTYENIIRIENKSADLNK
jgi:hypothetical protein